MLIADKLEQVFLKRKGGGYEFLLVLEDAAGARERVTYNVPPALATNEEAATRSLGRWLSARGARSASKLRVRREVGGELTDAGQLREVLLAALTEQQDE